MMTVRTRRRSHATRAWAGLVLVWLLLAGTAPASTTAASTAYKLDLGVRSDFVAQTNLVQCVGASMQMMLNMIEPGADRTAATQLKLQKLARTWSGPRRNGRERQGASVRGWAAGLTLRGAGPYKVVGTATLDEALLMAARAMRNTGRPVGLLVWRGRHAWVMSGFKATKDPLVSGARVTAAIVEDPLHPRSSSVWGPSPAPGATLTLRELGRQFVARRHSSFAGHLGGKYVLVLPYEYGTRMLHHRR